MVPVFKISLIPNFIPKYFIFIIVCIAILVFFLQKAEKKHDHLMATDWSYAIKEHIKTGLESPTPYKVIPYKNGIGIKKIEFIKPIK